MRTNRHLRGATHCRPVSGLGAAIMASRRLPMLSTVAVGGYSTLPLRGQRRILT